MAVVALPAWVITLIKILVVLGLIVLALLVLDSFRRWFASLAALCRLQTPTLMKDTCVGSCPPGSSCTILITRPYFWGSSGGSTD